MTNFFDSVKKYAAKWQVVNTRNFTQEELAMVESAKVVESSFGLSVCFTFVGGACGFTPLSNTSTKSVGDSIDLANAKLVTLYREGDGEINRIEA